MTAKALLLATAMLCATAIIVAVILARDTDPTEPSLSDKCEVSALC